MKQLIFALLLVATFSTKLVSQTADPTKWTVVYNSINDKEGEIVVTATIDKGWHTYSIRKTADGPIPTSVTFESNKNFELLGELVEGEAHEVYDKAFDAKLFVFDDKAVFKHKVKLSGKAGFTIKLKVEYMCCNDMMCLPPKTIDLSVVTKK
ncbi:MAG: protein-disulfide reductase DsbD domain-containing protein [Sphingobacteriaceae bacterium]|jgi:DsbC/DsbD-like thiol-disulfide interchange protein